jgi:hypothetical protein
MSVIFARKIGKKSALLTPLPFNRKQSPAKKTRETLKRI